MFYDIFEKSRKKTTIKKTKIIVDIHEKNSLILSELIASNEVIIEKTALDIGDYVIGDIVIERKTISDLFSSIMNKRINLQFEKMKKYENRLLMIEGDISNSYKKINPEIIRGFVLASIINHKTPVIFTKDYRDSSKYLIRLSKRELMKNKEITLHYKKPKKLDEKKRYILESFPGIGPSLSKRLLDNFNNLMEIFVSDEEKLFPILKNKYKEFKEILNN
ncbi:MAG: ERCC4 domain-containing protein [Candidatus Pacearchaeota archaeon]|jgi:ERCC4-type nuclease